MVSDEWGGRWGEKRSERRPGFGQPGLTSPAAGLKAPVIPPQFPEVVPLNIGGAHFTTRLSTLRRYEDTMLAAMFSGRHYIPTDAEGRYFIDRDGIHFGYVLPSAVTCIVLVSKWPGLGPRTVIPSLTPGRGDNLLVGFNTCAL